LPSYHVWKKSIKREKKKEDCHVDSQDGFGLLRQMANSRVTSDQNNDQKATAAVDPR